VRDFFARSTSDRRSPNSQLLVYVARLQQHRASGRRAGGAVAPLHRPPPGVLSLMWPSAGSLLRYLTDVYNAAAKRRAFARLIELLAAHTRASSIDVLAYSAGAQVASPGLAMLGAERPENREMSCAGGCGWGRSTSPPRTSTRAASSTSSAGTSTSPRG